MNWNTNIKELDEREEGYSYIEEDELDEEEGGHPLSGALKFAFLLILCAAAALFVWKNFFASAPAPDITDSVIKEQLQYVKDLVTLEYHYTNADKYEGDAASLFGIPLTGKVFIVLYDGVIKYRVNLADMEIKVYPESKEIRITLPKSEISSHEIPEDSIRVLDERDGLFSQNSISDLTEFWKERKQEMEKKGDELGMPEKAERQCEETVRAFLETLPGIEAYQITIKTK